MGRFVSIASTWDPVRAELIKDVLHQEGISATIAGAHHNALLGAAGAMIEIRVQVLETEAIRASEILSAMDDEDQILVDDSPEARELSGLARSSGPATRGGDGPYRAAPDRVVPARPRLKRIAAALALITTFGTGHLYAGARSVGLALLLVQLAILCAGVTNPMWMWALPALIAYDLFGSVRFIERMRTLPARA